MADPFHYVRLQQTNGPGKKKNLPARDPLVKDLLIVGGEDQKTGRDEGVEDRFSRLIDWARAHTGQWGESLVAGGVMFLLFAGMWLGYPLLRRKHLINFARRAA